MSLENQASSRSWAVKAGRKHLVAGGMGSFCSGRMARWKLHSEGHLGAVMRIGKRRGENTTPGKLLSKFSCFTFETRSHCVE